jgi:hypothetical protein
LVSVKKQQISRFTCLIFPLQQSRGQRQPKLLLADFGDFPFCFGDFMPWPGRYWIFQSHFISCVFPALSQKECTV